MRTIILTLFIVSLFLSCSRDKTHESNLFQKFESKFPFNDKDTILIRPDYDTLDKLERIDCSFMSLLDSLTEKIDFQVGLTFYFKFKIDSLWSGFVITDTAPEGMFITYLFLKEKDIDKLIYVDQVGKFYERHNSGDYLQTIIVKSKDTLVLTKKFKFCDFRDNPQFGDCKDSMRVEKIFRGLKF